MTDVVGVVFNRGGKVYYFDPSDLELHRGSRVVVQTMKGTEIGEVVDPPHQVADEDIPAPLKRVVRVAAQEDLRVVEENERFKGSAMITCRELIEKHGLDMKLVDAEVAFGGGKITFSFFAEERVDFRALVADLARTLKMRIELRQIGAREEAKLIGGLGPCGRNLCCRSFQVSQEPVSIRMAKEQQLPLNPSKISGLCGRLMCCLKYEQEQYVDFRKQVPKCGSKVETSRGRGTVVSHKVPNDAVTVRFEDGTETDFPVVSCNCGDSPCRVVERCPNEPETGPITIRHGDRPTQGAPAASENEGESCEEPPWKHVPTEAPDADVAALGDEAGNASHGSDAGKPAEGGKPAADGKPAEDGKPPNGGKSIAGGGSGKPSAEGGGSAKGPSDDGTSSKSRRGGSRRRRRRPRKGGGSGGGGGEPSGS